MIGRKAPQARDNIIQNITNFTQVDGNDHLEYFVVPLFQGRTTSKYFEKLKKKSSTKIDGWSNKILSTGGKMVLINSILCSIPIYTLGASAAPKKVIRELKGTFSTFLWGKYQGKPIKEIEIMVNNGKAFWGRRYGI